MEQPRQTLLCPRHVALGASMVEFSGWTMPVQYDGILAEHHRTRQTASVFDTSHMGAFLVEGSGALDGLSRLLSQDVRSLRDGRLRYGFLLDDLIAHRFAYASKPEPFVGREALLDRVARSRTARTPAGCRAVRSPHARPRRRPGVPAPRSGHARHERGSGYRPPHAGRDRDAPALLSRPVPRRRIRRGTSIKQLIRGGRDARSYAWRTGTLAGIRHRTSAPELFSRERGPGSAADRRES